MPIIHLETGEHFDNCGCPICLHDAYQHTLTTNYPAMAPGGYPANTCTNAHCRVYKTKDGRTDYTVGYRLR